MDASTVAFIGGGNMARALIGGLLQSGRPPASVRVVEPAASQRDGLLRDLGVAALPVADATLADAALVVWAVKPQAFAEAAAPCAPHVAGALQLSVMAGVRSATIAAASGSDRVVRAMPNTPALIGRGIAGLYARPSVGADERAAVEALLAPTGALLWVARESDLDAVTAISGSGPAYVFYILEAMVKCGVEMGLSTAQARQLAFDTFDGSVALARGSPLQLADLRAQVTSKGGTTHAAIEVLRQHGVQEAFEDAMRAARLRAEQLGA